MVRISGNSYYYDNPPDGQKINPKALFPGTKTQQSDTPAAKPQPADTTSKTPPTPPEDPPTQQDSTVVIPEGCRRIGSYAETGITLYGLLREECITLAQLIELNPEYFVAENKDKNGNWILKEGAILRIKPETDIRATEEAILDEGKTYYGAWQIEPKKGAYSIMTKFNLFEEEIRFLNPDIDLNNININDIFKVPGYKFKTGDTLENVAKNHDITVEMLKTLNPNIDFTKEIPTGTILNVPKRAGETIIPEEEISLEETQTETTPAEIPQTITHTVKSKETLSKIALNYNVPMWAVMLKNNIEDPDKINEGDILEIPTPEEIKQLEEIKKAKETPQEKPKEHIVKENETLSEIAIMYEIDKNDLIKWNNIQDPNKIKKGQVLRLTPPESTPQETPPKPTTTIYVVKANDTLSQIAEKYKTKTSIIMLKNGITNPKHIQPGQKLIIPSKEEAAELEKKQAELKAAQKAASASSSGSKKSSGTSGTSSSSSSSSSKKTTPPAPENKISLNQGIVIYKIKKGDTLETIAQKYGVSVTDLKTYNSNLKNIKAKDNLSDKHINTIEIIATPKAIKDALGVSQQFLDDLISIEKKRPQLYRDAVGIPTIGVGHNTQASKETSIYQNVTLNDNQIYSLLARDIAKAQKTLKDNIGEEAFNNLSRGQKEALYGLIFNVGDLSGSPKLIAALKSGDYKEAACQMDQAYGGGKVLPGLAKRRFMDIARFVEASNLKQKDIKYVMETTVQDLYTVGYRNITYKNSRVDFNAYAKKFLGPYIDKGYITLIEA